MADVSVSVGPSHQTVPHYTPYVNDWFPNTRQYFRFLTACRRFEKLVLPSIFDASLSSLMMWNFAVIQQWFWKKECDIFRGQNILWPFLHIFRELRPPGSTPLPSVAPCTGALGPAACLGATVLPPNFVSFPSRIEVMFLSLYVCLCEQDN